MGTLFLVATPIGNLSDMTPRAIETLGAVALIAAEDTRRSRQLLNHFGIENRVISYHQFNERARRDQLLAALDAGDVALVTDAGTPAVADPAADLVRAALAAGHTVSPIPGASALTAAASASGLIDGPFVMLGFLPRGGEERKRLLGRGVASNLPLVLFEAPGRLRATLDDLHAAAGDREAVVCRELTKLHEEVVPGRLSGLAERFAGEVRGEIVIVVGAAGEATAAEESVESVLRSLLATGMKPSAAAREAAAMTGQPRSGLYALAEQIRKADRDGQ
ncbi:MAG: 16S rRNA (cytidine(1402)-2'-O)-methyltransferase [Thermomicrobiales bacterium]|nr:16S rRNA (cytidine(1402)-2'-O)-methyltransferase [Thermomicrobiales bacterium]